MRKGKTRDKTYSDYFWRLDSFTQDKNAPQMEGSVFLSDQGTLVINNLAASQSPQHYIYLYYDDGSNPGNTKTYASVQKIWNDGIRPDSVQVQLLANGAAQGDPVTLNQDNHWAHRWDNLDQKDDSGNTIVYSVSEPDVPEGYVSGVVTNGLRHYVITNTHTSSRKTTLVVEKKVEAEEGITVPVSFSFYVTNAEGKYLNTDGSLSETKVTHQISNHGYVNFLNTVVGEYTVVEETEDAQVEDAQLSVVYGGAASADGRVEVKYHADGQTTKATITNQYTGET